MDKMKLAHDAALAMIKNGCSLHTAIADAWAYADAMQAEADKRNNTERPEVLCEVDWTQAPSSAIGWMFFDGASTWLGADGFLIEDAPSFGFTGSHIVERPE